MNDKQQDLALGKTDNKSVRPALITSVETFAEFPALLRRLMVGFADESIPAAVVCSANQNLNAVVSGVVDIIRHPAFNMPLLWKWNRKILVERLENFAPTVLHCLCQTKAELTRRLARQLDLPYVLTVNAFQKRWAQFSISSKRCVKIISPAKSIAANLAQVYPRFAERIEHINIGTFTEDKPCCFSRPDQLPSIVTAVPADNFERFENLLAAIRHLAIDGYEFMLVVISSGKSEKRLRHVLTALGLNQIAVVIPHLEPRRSVLSAADIFVQAAPKKQFNTWLLEAMSVGTAVATCIGGVDDLVIDSRTALVFDTEDELSIKTALQQLLDAHDFARKLAKNAQKILTQNYSVSSMISSTLRVYRDAQNLKP
ncbi:MAG: glycosyltransferase family 4 protein [Planctomycetota bacterium]|jgi:glycosyltransferase involved in cell wall biosynthesis